jgi:hypothetical protein
MVGGKTVNLKLDIPQKPIQTKRQVENEIVKNAQNSHYTDIAVLAFPGKGTVQHNVVVDLTENCDSNGNLQWNAPVGKWKILRFGYRPTGRNLNGVFISTI